MASLGELGPGLAQLNAELSILIGGLSSDGKEKVQFIGVSNQTLHPRTAIAHAGNVYSCWSTEHPRVGGTAFCLV